MHHTLAVTVSEGETKKRKTIVDPYCFRISGKKTKLSRRFPIVVSGVIAQHARIQ